MKDALMFLLKQLVDHPEDVQIEEKNETSSVIYVVKTHPDDVGKVIGKSGRIIKAIRDLMKIIASKHNTYVDVTLAESPPNG